MERIDDLEKAITETAQAGVDLLKKSQMSLFGDPHHVGYTRVNASGTASQIQAKGQTIQKRPTHHGAASEEAENYSKRAWISDDTKDGHDAAEAALTHSASLHEKAAEEADHLGDPRLSKWHERKADLHRQMAEEHGAESHRQWTAEQQAKQVAAANEKLATEGNFREGDDVRAHEEYGGKKGRVKGQQGSYIIVEHEDGTDHSYHFTDLDHHDTNEDEDKDED